MKFVLVIFVAQIAVCLTQKYNTRFDNVNIDMILSNKRVLHNYVKCILDEGPCTAEGRELKDNIPDALRTNCVKCTDAQKRLVRKGATFLIQNEPKEWSRIARKYDPTGELSPQFRQFLNA